MNILIVVDDFNGGAGNIAQLLALKLKEQNNNITFNISNLPQGVYLLKICYKTDFEILKFQK